MLSVVAKLAQWGVNLGVPMRRMSKWGYIRGPHENLFEMGLHSGSPQDKVAVGYRNESSLNEIYKFTSK